MIVVRMIVWCSVWCCPDVWCFCFLLSANCQRRWVSSGFILVYFYLSWVGCLAVLKQAGHEDSWVSFVKLNSY